MNREPVQRSGTQPAQRSGTQPAQRSGSQPADVQAAFCAVLVDEWARAGVTEAVVAPGSRSTPLIIALDDDPRIRVHVVLDERSAGFVALGIGLSTGRPAVVATTSGTAAVELHPAVVEAHQAGVPLIAVTSDRPWELHHVGAPQTVEQDGLFGSAVRLALSLAVADIGAMASWRPVASRIVTEALAGPDGPGPVHANLAFREPLIGDPASVAVPAGRAGSAPWHTVGQLDRPEQPPPDVADLLGSFSGDRGLVLAGGGCGAAGELLDAASELGWPVLADPRSGCRAGSSSGAVASADSLLRVPAIAGGWIPDVIVRAGAPWASKVLSRWVASLPPDVPQVLCDPWGRRLDPERTASVVVRSGAAALLRAAAVSATRSATRSSSPAESHWRRQWLDADASAQSVFDALLGPGGELEMSEPAVARALTGSCHPGTRLVASSSMPVRDVEWFAPPFQPVEVLSNRGANGIDGVLSTAVGVAASAPRPVAALLGDLAFLYDAGALLWAGARDLSLTVVVIDNAGGGIFSFLPQATEVSPDRFERYWGTPHGVDLANVARAYGVRASTVDSRADLDRVVSTVGKPGVSVAIVRSERESNVKAHDRLNAAVASALDSGGL